MIYQAVFGSRKTVVLVILAVIATVLTETTIFLIPLLFALVAIGRDLKLLLSYYLFWSILLFLSLMIMQATGVIIGGEVAQDVDGVEVMAQALGFGNPNGAFTYLFSILVTSYVLLEKSLWKTPFTIVAIVAILAIYSQTLSRTGLICCLLVVLFAYIGKIVPWRRVREMLPAFFVGLTLLSIILAVYVGEMGNPINDVMSNRPYWWSLRVNDGALLNMLGNGDSFATDYAWWRNTAPLDSFFLRIWFQHGLVILTIFFIFFRIWSKGINNKMLVFGTLAALLYGFSEYGVIANPGRNVLLLIMMVPLFSSYMENQKVSFFRTVTNEK